MCWLCNQLKRTFSASITLPPFEEQKPRNVTPAFSELTKSVMLKNLPGSRSK